MKINIKTKDYKIGKRLEGLIDKKLSKLDRYFNDDAQAAVFCRVENKTHVLELSIRSKGMEFRSEVRSDNMYNNLDVALPKLERQIVKFAQKRKNFGKVIEMEQTDLMFIEEVPEIEDRRITKVKQFELEPISVEDACDLLDNTEHDFYVFLNRNTNKVNLIYGRKDGNIGHIKLDY